MSGENQHLLILDVRQTHREGFVLNLPILSTHTFALAFQTNSCINNAEAAYGEDLVNCFYEEREQVGGLFLFI